MHFDLFRIDVLAVAEDNDFLLAARKKEVALGIKIAEIASEEPSVFHYRLGCIWTVPVSLHHAGSADSKFAHGRPTVFLRLRINDLAFNPFHGLAARTDDNVSGRIDVDGGGRLGQPQGLHHVDAEIVEILRDCGIEARSAGRQVAHFRAKSVMDLAKEDGACVDADFPQGTIQQYHDGKDLLRNRAALLDFLKDSLVDQVEELRHDGESGDVALLQRLQQFGSVESLQIDDARSLDQRQE